LITNYTLQEFKYEICGIKYKTKRGLNYHQSIVRKYNIRHEGLYMLPLEAVNQFKKDLIYIISSKLKAHFTQLGRQTLSFPCLESLFFE
ncbi:1270_t:CDS:1, partial [Scutellospora calospora]